MVALDKQRSGAEVLSGELRPGALMIGSSAPPGCTGLTGEQVLLEVRVELAQVVQQPKVMGEFAGLEGEREAVGQLGDRPEMRHQLVTLAEGIPRVSADHRRLSLSN